MALTTKLFLFVGLITIATVLAKPATTKPSATKPSTTKPSATKPSTTKPSTKKPSAKVTNPPAKAASKAMTPVTMPNKAKIDQLAREAAANEKKIQEAAKNANVKIDKLPTDQKGLESLMKGSTIPTKIPDNLPAGIKIPNEFSGMNPNDLQGMLDKGNLPSQFSGIKV